MQNKQFGSAWGLISPDEFFRATPMQRIRLMKAGLSASDAKDIISHLAMAPRMAFEAVGVSEAVVNRRARRHEPLSPAEAERVLGVAKLVGQLQVMVEESGELKGFNAAVWLSDWLREPLPALEGARPIELLDTMEGQGLIAKLLSQLQSSASP